MHDEEDEEIYEDSENSGDADSLCVYAAAYDRLSAETLTGGSR